MLKNFWKNDISRFLKIQHNYRKLINIYQKRRLGDTRALMHLVPFHTRSSLAEHSKVQDYKWVILTKHF